MIVSGLACPVDDTVTVNPQVSPVAAVQVTVVLPTGKAEPEGGLQTTPPPPSELEPQLPDVVGVAKVTTALHWEVYERDAGAGAVVHTHSLAATVLSRSVAPESAFAVIS